MVTMVTYEIRKEFEDGRDVCYFTAHDFDCVMQDLWNKHKYESGCYLVIKVPTFIDKK